MYAGSELVVYPSRIDTLGQAVIEAQACGVPVLVSAEGGPREMMDDGVSGMVLDGADAAAWAQAINTLLNDEPLRQRMARTAPHRIVRFAIPRAFDAFWSEHDGAVRRRGQKVDEQAREVAPTMSAKTPRYGRETLWRECSEPGLEASMP